MKRTNDELRHKDNLTAKKIYPSEGNNVNKSLDSTLKNERVSKQYKNNIRKLIETNDV